MYKTVKSKLILYSSLFLLLTTLSCVTRYEGKCKAPKEYANKSVANILNDSEAIVKRPGEKKAVAYAMYGSKEIYMQGLRENLVQVKKRYPGWDFVLYADSKTVPQAFLDELKAQGAIIYADPSYNHASSRFFVADLDYDRFIVRDSDSRIYPREIAAVADWIKNDWAWLHGMRDAESANDPLQGGMWGAVTKKLREKLQEHFGTSKMETLYYQFMKGKNAIYGDDQKFLAEIVVKAIGYDHFMSHESVDCDAFPNSRGFPIPKGTSDIHIGTRVIP